MASPGNELLPLTEFRDPEVDKVPHRRYAILDVERAAVSSQRLDVLLPETKGAGVIRQGKRV